MLIVIPTLSTNMRDTVKHELVTTMTFSNVKGTFHIKKIKCNGKYTVAPIGANYCPECGEEFK